MPFSLSTASLPVLTCLVFLFFGLHNLLQEAIMALPNSPSGILLGFLEVLGVTVCTHVERSVSLSPAERVRKAPVVSFLLLTFCLLSSSSLSNLSLNYIAYPTKVVFRSCKLIPTMLMATFINEQSFKPVQYLAAVAICIGLVTYAAADMELSPSFNPFGLILVTLSVCADAVLPNAQQAMFESGTSRSEVTYFTNVYVLVAMSVSLLVSGEFSALLTFARSSTVATVYMGMYTAVSYVAITTHMTAIKRFGGVTTVLIGTARKAMTIILSFLFFPKAFSWYYIVGTALVLGGLSFAEMDKVKTREKKSADRSIDERKRGDEVKTRQGSGEALELTQLLKGAKSSDNDLRKSRANSHGV